MTKNLADVLRAELADDPKLAAAVEREALAANVACQIYEARTAAGLSQAKLAALVGTKQSVIARMEDADYSGHSLRMLAKIADALEKRVYIEFRKRFTDEFMAPAAPQTFSMQNISWRNVLPSWHPTITTEETTGTSARATQELAIGS